MGSLLLDLLAPFLWCRLETVGIPASLREVAETHVLVLLSDGDSRQVDVDARDRHKNRSDGSKNVLFLLD